MGKSGIYHRVIRRHTFNPGELILSINGDYPIQISYVKAGMFPPVAFTEEI